MNINIIVINQKLLNHRVDDKKDEIVNVIIIPLLIYLAERERTTLIERINDGIRNMPVNDLGRKFSRKTGNCVERLLSPLINLFKEDSEMLERVKNKEISVNGFCRYMGISRQSYYKYYKHL